MKINIRLIILILCMNFLCNLNYAQLNSIKNYTINNGLSSNNITSCVQDFEGYMWFCTDKGLCKFNGENFTNYDVKKLHITNSEIVYSYRSEKNKEIWFYTIKGEFIKYTNQQFHLIPFNSNGVDYIFRLGILWSINKDTLRNEFTNTNYFLNIKLPIYLIYQIDKNQIIINDNLYQINKLNQLTFIRKYFDINKYINHHTAFFNNSLIFENNQYSKQANIFYYTLDSIKNLNIPKLDVRNFIKYNEYLLIAGMSGGITVFNLKNNTYTKYFEDIVCQNIYIDLDKNVWLITRNNGIILFNVVNNVPAKMKFDNLNFIRKINSKIITGDNNGNVFILDSMGNIESKINYIKSLNFNNVRSFDGIYFHSNYYFISDLGLIKVKDNKQSLIYESALKYITHDSTNIYFSNNKAIYCYNETALKLICENKNIKQLYNFQNTIFLIIDDTIYSIVNNQLKFIKVVKDIVNVYCYKNNIIYHTLNSILFENTNNKREFNFKDYDFTSRIKQIKVLNDTTYILATNNGLFILKYINKKFVSTHFNIESGISNNLLTGIEIYNDRVIISSESGLEIINIRDINKSFKYKFFQINSNIKSDSLYTFKFNQEIKIELSSTYFNSNRNLRYEYYLVSNNNNKSDKIQKIITTEPKIIFTNIQAGDYVLHVKAINSSDIYSNNELKFKFKVLPPFYQTYWFYTLLGIIILTILGLIIYIYINKIRTDNNIMRLQSLSLQSQMNPHFIFNALNSINSFIYNNNKNEANAYLSKISHLIRKSLDHSTTKSISLYDEILLLKNYLEIEKMRFGDKLIYTITIDENIEVDDIDVPPFFTQIMAENAIIHGISQIDSTGKIDVEFKIINNSLIYIVKDNGNGLQIKYNKEHQSKGLLLLNQRIQLFNRNKEENIILKNIINNNNQIIGTISTLTLKINT